MGSRLWTDFLNNDEDGRRKNTQQKEEVEKAPTDQK